MNGGELAGWLTCDAEHHTLDGAPQIDPLPVLEQAEQATGKRKKENKESWESLCSDDEHKGPVQPQAADPALRQTVPSEEVGV